MPYFRFCQINYETYYYYLPATQIILQKNKFARLFYIK
jgi:hypothetical protein